MPSYVLKQPNGKFAIFDSIVDDLTWFDMTEEEVLEVGTEQWGRAAAIEKIDRGIDDAPLWEDTGETDGLSRWRKSCESIALQHGLRHLRSRMNEMDLGDVAIPQCAVEMAESVESDMDPDSERFRSRM
jgi:hypothetical protein